MSLKKDKAEELLKGWIATAEGWKARAAKAEKDLTQSIEARNNLNDQITALRAAAPPKMDKRKVEDAANGVMASLLMDAKGALTASQNPECYAVAMRIMAAEGKMGALMILEASVIQRLKALAELKRAGREVSSDDLNELVTLAERFI